MSKYRDRRHKLREHDRTEKFRLGGASARRAQRKYFGKRSAPRMPERQPVTHLPEVER